MAERAIELALPPKLGISGSLASYFLIRRLGLEEEHNKFINTIINEGAPEKVEEAVLDFEAKVKDMFLMYGFFYLVV